jgi:SWIM/SEC-C metal-binding protein
MGKIGTERNPAIVRVRTEERAQEIFALCQEHGIQVIVGVEPDKREDISDVERTLQGRVPTTVNAKVDRNDPCPCGSGKRYKRCCGGRRSA